jgi:hypothetical protein
VDTISFRRNPLHQVIDSERLLSSSMDRDTIAYTAGVLKTIGEHSEKAQSRLQSAVAEVRERRTQRGDAISLTTSVLARVETVGGPVLLGTSSSDISVALPFDELAELPADCLGSAAVPPDLRDRPILVHPSVAAVLIAGTVFSLTSRNGRRTAQQLEGRKVLPSLTLIEPAAARGMDDLGLPDHRFRLVDGGVMGPPMPAGIRPGHAVWDHDTGRCVADPTTRVELRGNPSVPPDHALELVWCVEGLQRYHADGTVRLRCLARLADRPGDWFSLVLRGKPIHLLRYTTGVHGRRTTVYTDSEVTTQSLVLASARTMEEKGHGSITVVDT